MEDALRSTFYAFAGYGTRQAVQDIDGPRFVKIMKDAGVVDKRFSSTDVDIVFAKVKTKGSRRIAFGQFLEALEHIAERKNVSLDHVVTMILDAFPVTNATQAAYVKYHDDKTTYTGVYAKGGPTNIDKLRATPGGLMSSLCDRSPADVRGVKASYPYA